MAKKSATAAVPTTTAPKIEGGYQATTTGGPPANPPKGGSAAKRTRKLKLVDHPVDRELEDAVAELDVPTSGVEEAAIARLGFADFFLKPRLAVQVSDEGTLTLSAFDAFMPAGQDPMGPTVAVEVLPGTLPSYRVDVHATDDLLFTLDRALNPDRAAVADRARNIDRQDLEATLARTEAEITDLTGKLSDSEAARERDIASLRADLDEADRVKGHAENLTEAALSKAVEDGKTIGALQAQIAGLETALSIKSKANTAHQSANAALRRQVGDDAARIAELELQLASSRTRPPFLQRLRAVFAAPAEGRV